MRTYKITVVYDGTKYQGWQRQSNTSRTIQETLERVISNVTGYFVQIDGSGRTDSGVHARGQIASFCLSGRMEEKNFRGAVNALLPDDIKISDIALVKSGFHARYSAKAKVYTYQIDYGEKQNVFLRKYTYHHHNTLSVTKMQQAAHYLVGTKDFHAFTDMSIDKSAVRTIYNIQIEQENTMLKITYYGTGFLYHMVRIITGTLIEVGDGRKQPEDILTILDSKERKNAGFLAPAHGLCMEQVFYK